MSKVKIYTYSHNRPDFIKLQHETIKRHVKNDYEFIVFNNERPGGDPGSGYSYDRYCKIFDVCEKLGIECIGVELDPNLKYINGYLQFENESFVLGGSYACSYAFTWGWKHYISKNNCISVIIDSDMFFIREVSFSEMMKGYNFSFVPHYRHLSHFQDEDNPGEFAFSYPWNGIVISDVPNMPNPSELSWGLANYNGITADVGGECVNYMNKYKNDLRINYLDQISIQRDRFIPQDPHTISKDESDIEVGINGSLAVRLGYSKENDLILPFEKVPPIITGGAQESDERSYPHQIKRKNYWDYFKKSFQYIIDQFSKKYNFPKPTFIDLIKLETDEMDKSFIFHYKNASNSHVWMGEDYNIKKTEALYCLLKDYNN
jgi:hypothetical protein